MLIDSKDKKIGYLVFKALSILNPINANSTNDNAILRAKLEYFI